MTSKYFFHEPTRNSNLIVIVLGKKYYLHKIFLERSPYFMKLINEMKGNELHLRITDHQITLNSIDFVFCFIYEANVELNNNICDVVAILATAVLFRFDGIQNLVTKKIMNLCNIKNNSFALFNLVNVPELKTDIFKYLQINLMLMERYTMRDISIVTMSQLVMSKDFAITSEMDLYNMLKTWILELEDASIAEAFNMVDSIFSQLNIPNLTQYSNIRSLKKDNLIPIELIHDATDTNCEMMIRLMADIESIPEAKPRVLHRYAKVVWKTMGDQAWTSIDYRLGFAIKYFLSEKGLRFQKTRVQNVSFITKQVHRLSFCLQVFSLRSSEVQPILDRTLEFDCKIPNTFVLITTEDLRLPNARFPLVVSIKTTLYPTMLEVVRKKSKFHSLSKSNV